MSVHLTDVQLLVRMKRLIENSYYSSVVRAVEGNVRRTSAPSDL